MFLLSVSNIKPILKLQILNTHNYFNQSNFVCQDFCLEKQNLYYLFQLMKLGKYLFQWIYIAIHFVMEHPVYTVNQKGLY
jgi:hypothetical protein